MPEPPLPAADLDHVLDLVGPAWDGLRGRRLFLTGGTGFVGGWLLEAILRANDRMTLDCRVTLLTRDAGRLAARGPHLAGRADLDVLEGDVKELDQARGVRSDVVLHLAVHEPQAASAGAQQARFDDDLAATRAVLGLAARAGASRVLFTSSGAVYGRQPPSLVRVPEEYGGAPDPLDVTSAYAQAKRAGEFLCGAFAQATGTCVTVARCFTFVGPRLPLDAGYAVGNFIRDALAGGPLEVLGDGRPERSYLYAADLAAWLLTIVDRGSSGRAYNVGSEQAVSILDLASLVARTLAPGTPVVVRTTGTETSAPPRYVPSTERARKELGLTQRISLEDAVRRTADWHLSKRSPV